MGKTRRRWRLGAALLLVLPRKLGLERVARLLIQPQRPGTTVPDVTATAHRASGCRPTG